MAYTTINKSSDHFNTKLYTGNDTDDRAITGVGFQPDWTWIKLRNTTQQHELFDAVRGANKPISSNTTDAETTATNKLKSFDSDGFTLGTSTSVNKNYNYASWNWKAGNSSGSSNTDGTITSTVSANTTAGFSIVKWTGSGLKASTVGHGLGVKPDMIIARQYSNANKNWFVYHKGLTDDYTIVLNLTETQTSGSSYYTAGNIMKSASSPDTSTFSFNGSSSTTTNLNTSGSDNIAYCFAEKKGFSKFGTYTGNGNASGSFIYTGFKPAFFMWKRSSSSGGWYISDNKRDTFNEVDVVLSANDSGSESDQGTTFDHDFLSNGIKIRNNVASANSNGETFIYMAFAEAPLVGTNNIPATAR